MLLGLAPVDSSMSARDARLLRQMWNFSSSCRQAPMACNALPVEPRSCLCGHHHLPGHLARPPPPPPPGRASGRVFALPDLVEIIVGHLRGDAQSLLVLLYVNSITRSLATTALHEPESHQRTRELVVQSISRYQMPCLRRILSPLVALGPDPPHYLSGYTTEDDYSMIDPQLHAQTIMNPVRGRSAITIPLPSCLFAKIFHFLPSVRKIRKAVLQREPLSWSAVVLLDETPRFYPGSYEVDEDIVFSLACRQQETSEKVRLLLTRDRANPERAALRTGRSPLADMVEARLAQYPPHAYYSSWLPSDVTWLMIRGYILKPSDVEAIRRHGRTDLWAGLVKWAIGFDRTEEQAVLMYNATAEERALERSFRDEDRSATEKDQQEMERRKRMIQLRSAARPTRGRASTQPQPLRQQIQSVLSGIGHCRPPTWSWKRKNGPRNATAALEAEA